MMKKMTVLTAAVSAICLGMTFAACQKDSVKDVHAETSTERIEAHRESMSENGDAETTRQETTTVKETTTTSTSSTLTTSATSTTTLSTTTRATTRAAARRTETTAAAPKPVAQTTAQATAQEVSQTTAATVAAPKETEQNARTMERVLFVPVAYDDDGVVAVVQGAGEEPFGVAACGYYVAIDLNKNWSENTLPNDYSYWVTDKKKVLNYDLYYEYYSGEDGLIHFLNSDGEETYALSYQDFVLLCNCTAHEYGNANYVPMYERSLVTEVIMNRYWDWGYASIYDTITAPNAFSGSYTYADSDTMLSNVGDNVLGAVALYFCNYNNPDYYNEGYYFFVGDGVWNHFRTSY